jgi:succinoglycan biosynthesis transport protein ExoP
MQRTMVFWGKMETVVFRSFWHANCPRFFEIFPSLATSIRKGVFPLLPAQLTIDELRTVLRRRWKLLLFTSLIVIIISVIGAYTLPRKFVSYTKILVQRDETLNPLVSFTMAVTLASEDRLRTFNEIIFSRRMSQMIVDTLGLNKGVESASERDALIKSVERNIGIDRRGSDSFGIYYADTDPVRAQRAASLIADYFIRTNTEVENRRNELTVQFFQKKLDDYREKFEETQHEFISILKERIDSLPTEMHSLYGKLEEANRKTSDVEKRVQSYRQALDVLRMYPDSLHTEHGTQALFELQREDLPFVGDLHSLLVKYDESTRRYTSKYPEVEKLESEILDVLERIRLAVKSEITKQENQQWELEAKASGIVDDLKRFSALQNEDVDTESNYGIYRKLYDEMKVKLEQARTTRDLGARGASQYIILDPALVPTKPTRPNRVLIIGGGIGLGLLLGVLSVIAAELLDTRVRAATDIEKYHKPVIAFIPYAEYEEIKG